MKNRCIAAKLATFFIFAVLSSVVGICSGQNIPESLQPLNPDKVTNDQWTYIEGEVHKGRGNTFLPFLLEVIKHGKDKQAFRVPNLLRDMKADASLCVPTLIAELKLPETGQNEFLNSLCVTALSSFGPQASAAIPVIKQRLSLKNDGSRYQAVWALGAIGTQSKDVVIPILTKQLSDPSPQVVVGAHKELIKLTGDLDSHVAALIQMVQSGDNWKAFWAAHGLADLAPESKAAIPALIQGLTSSNADARIAEAESLGKFGGLATDAIPALKKMAVNDEISDGRNQAIASLSQIEGDNPEQDLLRKASDAKDAAKQKADWEAFQPKLLIATKLPPVDKVEIFTLALYNKSSDYDEIPSPGPLGTFPIKPYGSDANVLGKLVLDGEKAQPVATAWRSLHFDPKFQALCHGPIYGLRFYKKNQLIFETSMCWHCSNFYIDREFWGFDAYDANGKALLALLQKLLPLPKQ